MHSTPVTQHGVSRFIIGYGRREDVDVIDAPSLDEARMIATKRSMDDGLLDDGLLDDGLSNDWLSNDWLTGRFSLAA